MGRHQRQGARYAIRMNRSDAPAARDAVRGPEGASALDPGVRPQPRGRDSWARVIACLIFGSLWCVLPLSWVASPFSDLEREWRLPQEGVTTDGLVVARRVETDAEGNTSHHLTLAYDVPAGSTLRPRRLLYEAQVGAEAYADLPQGSRLPLLYLRSAPASARLAADSGVEVVFSAGLVIVFLVLFSGPGILFVLGGVASGIRLCRLAWSGRRVSGQVEECWLQPVADAADHKCVTVRFTPPGGSLQRVTEINPRAYRQLRPGSEVEVETVPQCPWICRLAQW